MWQKIAHSIGLYEIPILPNRETRIALDDYYTSLQAQLSTYFDQNVSVYHVQPDGNCLYRSLSHIIFGTGNCFDILKYNLINSFITSNPAPLQCNAQIWHIQ